MKNININSDFNIDRADPEAIRFDGLDYAIIGTDHNGLLVYDFDRMIDIFTTEQGMTEDEAIEWIDYNVLGVMGGKGFTILYSNEFI